MNHKVESADVEFVKDRGFNPIGWNAGAIDPKTGKINPQVTHFYLGGNLSVSVFHIKPVYYETIYGTWRPLSEITVHHGNRKIEFNGDWWKVHPHFLNWLDSRMRAIGGQLLIPSMKAIPTPYAGFVRMLHQSLFPPKLGLTTSTVYPDFSPESASVDGIVGIDGSTSSWATIQSAADGGFSNDSGATYAPHVGHNVSPSQYWLYRHFALFDTSGLPDGDTINSATFEIKATGSASYQDDLSLTNKSLRLVQTTPASNTALVTADYDQVGTTAGATDVLTADFAADTYETFTLNGTGLGWISKTGITKLGLRHTADTENEQPISPSGDDYNGRVLYSADTADVTSDPKLVIVHSSSSVNSGFFGLM